MDLSKIDIPDCRFGYLLCILHFNLDIIRYLCLSIIIVYIADIYVKSFVFNSSKLQIHPCEIVMGLFFNTNFKCFIFCSLS